MSIRSKTKHTWLQPLYNELEGRGVRQPQIGCSTGTVGLYGQTGLARIASGGVVLAGATNLGVSGLAATGVGASGLYHHLGRVGYGGSGTLYTGDDIVNALKNVGILPA